VLLRAQSGAPDSFGRLKGFAVAEVSGAYALSDRARFTLRLENLFDAAYQQAFGYGEPGRSAYAGVSLRY
jgi:vitamin B12 transporter